MGIIVETDFYDNSLLLLLAYLHPLWLRSEPGTTGVVSSFFQRQLSIDVWPNNSFRFDPAD